MKKCTIFTILVFLIGANLRMMITTIPPLLGMIQDQFHLSSSVSGILMTIPLLCFGLFSAFAGKLGKIFGSRLNILISLVLMGIGDILRVYSVDLMFLGTLLVGLTITVLNVLLPLFLVEYASENVRGYTGIYSVSMNIWAAIGSAVIVPIANAIGWQLAVQIFSVVALIAAVYLRVVLPNNVTPKSKSTNKELPESISVWKQGRIWTLALFMGMPASYFVPVLSENKSARAPLIWSIAAGYGLGIACLVSISKNWPIAILSAVLLGYAVAAVFTYSVSLITLSSRTSAETADVSGMVQTVGYLLAAVSPVLLGSLHASLSWNVILMIILVVGAIVIGLGLAVNRNLAKQNREVD
ncbi:MFS transporter [Pediococcus argentinicus]|uniref:MFS transporter n=1 Tax=Pediococcus argentinicus TaxID=480391 RepID=UPI00338E2132